MMCLYFLPCFLRQTHGLEACPFSIVVAHVSDSSERMSQVASTGVLSAVKARLAGAQQVMPKPLVRQRIVALVSWYRLSISDPEADR